MKNNPSGFTPLGLMLVIAFLGILIGHFMPNVQGARGAAVQVDPALNTYTTSHP